MPKRAHTHELCLQNRVLNQTCFWFSKITNYVRNSWKESIFSKDLECTTWLQIMKNNCCEFFSNKKINLVSWDSCSFGGAQNQFMIQLHHEVDFPENPWIAHGDYRLTVIDSNQIPRKGGVLRVVFPLRGPGKPPGRKSLKIGEKLQNSPPRSNPPKMGKNRTKKG